MEIPFQPTGPAREKSITLPPKGEFLVDYVLVFDEKRERTVYLSSPDFHQLGHAWTFDGESFTQISKEAVRTESPSQRWQGVYDAARGAVVAWNFGKDDDYEDAVYAVVLGDGGPVFFQPKGESPKRGEGSDETGGCFVYDRKRDVTVCMTALGVWEIGLDESWQKRHDGDGLPTAEWKEECVGGAWDPKSERAFFYFVCEDDDGDDRFWLYSWDGETLSLHDNVGLPDKLFTGWMNTGPILLGHPDGLVADCGWKKGAFLYDGKWKPWRDATEEPRPASAKAQMSWDPRLAAFVAGPGRYEPEKGTYPEDQHVFWVGTDGAWKKLGVTEKKSEISELWAKRFGAFVGGRYRMMGNYYLTLLEWSDAGWRTLVDKAAQKDLWDGGGSGKDVHALTGMVESDDGTLYLVSNEGQVFAFDEGAAKWTEIAGIDKEWKKRMWTALAWDSGEKRIVAWGGTIKGRKSNQALFYDVAKRKWKKAKKTSPQPKGFARKKDESDVEYQLVWDHGLGAIVRIGWEEAAVLDGEVFVPSLPAKMGELNGDSYRAVASDPKTGETLVVSFETGVIFRFDLGGCEEVGRFTLPADLQLGHTNEDLGYRVICDDWAFDPSSRTLHVQNPDDAWGHYTLSLGAAFDAAAKLGPRTRADGVVAPKQKALYLVDGDAPRFWFAKTHGKDVVVESGVVGAEAETRVEKTKTPEDAITKLDALAAAEAKRGFVGAKSLGEAELVRLACAPTRAISLGGPAKNDAHTSRLGGTPSDALLDAWPTTEREAFQQLTWHLPEELNFFEVPEADREDVLSDLRDGTEPEPLGFLLQIETGDLLAKHAGLAVYVDTSGVATESALHNRVRLLSSSDLKSDASCAPLAPVLGARALDLGEPSFEVDESRSTALTQRDPELAEALEALDLPSGRGFSKLGGAPTWVQSPRTTLGKGQVPYRFVMQFDFDGISELKDECPEWPDAELFGVLYIFVNADETAATAFWQYT